MEVSKQIRSAGLKVTQQRRIVYETMRSLKHSAIDAVISVVREQHPDISVATVYRIMELFCESGLLLKFMGPNGRAFFDITPKDHLHIFTSTERVVDLNDPSLKELIYSRIASQLPPGECLDQISICITTKVLTDNNVTNN